MLYKDVPIPKPPYYKPREFMKKLAPFQEFGLPKEFDSRRNPKLRHTAAHERFWYEELYKIHNGFWIGEIFIPGFFYYYMNYKYMQTINGVIMPDMVDLYLEISYFLDWLYESKEYNGLYPKARRKGVSEISQTFMDYKWRFTNAFKGGVAAGLKTYNDDFISKWIFGSSSLPLELQVAATGTYVGTDEIIRTYEEKNSNGMFETKGLQNVIYSRTMKMNPNMFKGLYLNLVISEEIGEHENWFSFYNATKDALMSGNIKKGVFCGYGCVCAGTKVWDNKGNFVNIEDLKQNQGIIGFDEEKGVLSNEPITWMQPPSEKHCYRITTNTGRFLECSDDHPILVRDSYQYSKRNRINWKKTNSFIEAHKVKIGDNLAIIEDVDIWSEKRMFEPRLTGWLVGDGSYGGSKKSKAWNITLINADQEIYDYISSKYITRIDVQSPTKDGRILRKFRINGRYLRDAFRDMGIDRQSKSRKTLPKNLHSYSKKDVCEFIGGFFDADGCIYTNNKTKETFLKLSSAYFNLLDETRYILQKIGIRCNIMYSKPRASEKLGLAGNGHYNLIIKDRKSVLLFNENISFFVYSKKSKMRQAIRNVLSQKGVINRRSDVMKGLRYETVKNVEYIGIKPIYNLTAGNTHTYVANGIITHNTAGNVNKGSKDFKKLSEEAEKNNFVELLINATRKYYYGGSKLPESDLPMGSHLFKTHKPSQLIGVEDLILAEKDILETRDKLLKAGDMKAYNEHLQNNPLTKADMFRKSVVNNFNINLLNDQSHEINFIQEKKYSRWILEWELNDQGLRVVPLKVKARPALPYEEDWKCVLIIDSEHPRKNVKAMYVAGIDSYDQDTSKTSKSLGAMCVRIRMNNIGGAMRRAPVAVIRNRPPRKELFYENCLKLAVYYNIIGNVLGDVRTPGIIAHWKLFGAEKYLAGRPAKFESPDSDQGHEYWVSLNKYSKPLMVSAMQTNVEDNIKQYWFPALVDEYQNYDEVEVDSDNDLADADGIAIMQDICCEVRPKSNDTDEKDTRFELPEYGTDKDGNLVMAGDRDVIPEDQRYGNEDEFDDGRW